MIESNGFSTLDKSKKFKGVLPMKLFAWCRFYLYSLVSNLFQMSSGVRVIQCEQQQSHHLSVAPHTHLESSKQATFNPLKGLFP